jgi:hypothetical protein
MSRRQVKIRITGREGTVCAKPAARNIAMVPVSMAERLTRVADNALTSTGWPSTLVAPCARANATAALEER